MSETNSNLRELPAGVAHEIYKKIRVSFLGSGSDEDTSPMYQAMRTAGGLVAEAGAVVFSGAYKGSGMAAAAQGAKEAGGISVGFTAGFPIEANAFLTYVVSCAKWAMTLVYKLAENMDFFIRLASLMSADAFVMGAGGGVGTALEALTYLFLSHKIWHRRGNKQRRPLAFLILSEPNDWDAVILAAVKASSEEVTAFIRIVHTPEDAADFVLGRTKFD